MQNVVINYVYIKSKISGEGGGAIIWTKKLLQLFSKFCVAGKFEGLIYPNQYPNSGRLKQGRKISTPMIISYIFLLILFKLAADIEPKRYTDTGGGIRSIPSANA